MKYTPNWQKPFIFSKSNGIFFANQELVLLIRWIGPPKQTGSPRYYVYYPLRSATLRHGNYTQSQKDRTRINHAIRAKELRVVGAQRENLGVLTREEALKAAEEANLDLIEISPNAKPPVAKIMDYGKYRYETSRKAREVKAKSHVTETKSVQVKIGTGENDQRLKAKRIAQWLEEGHRVKIDLFLWGRYKYMEEGFLKERLERFLKIVPAEYKIADEVKRSPKGFTTTIERVAGTKKSDKSSQKNTKDIEDSSNPRKGEMQQKSKKKSLDELIEEGIV